MKALLVIIMSVCLHVTYAQKPDTTKTFIQGKELDEVVVKTSILLARMTIFLPFLPRSSVSML